MQTGNTFTYQHSELPPARAEIKAEIVGLDVYIADLILKSQGNYRELEELAEVLDNCLDSCELNLNLIRIVADDSPRPSVISIQDLSMPEKEMIFSIANTSSLMLKILSQLWEKPCEEVARRVAAAGQVADLKHSEQEVNEYIEKLSKVGSEIHGNGSNFVFRKI